MSIATELQRIKQAKDNIIRALNRKNIYIPSGYTLDKYAAFIDQDMSGKTIEWKSNPSNYLSFKFISNGTVSWQNNKGDIQYSKDGGNTWINFNGTEVTCNIDDEIWFKGTLTGGCGNSSSSSSSKFNTSGKFYVSGNIQSLSNFNNTLANYHFAYLFYNCEGLNIDIEKKVTLPATALTSYCYYCMFYGCTSLTSAPELPATTLATYCYGYMFADCTSLTTASIVFRY